MRISNKKDLPSWFALEKYNVFSSMNDYDFINQIIFRVHGALDDLDNDLSYFNEVVKVASNEEEILEEQYRKDYGFDELTGPYQMIAEDIGVTPLSATDVCYMQNIIHHNEIVPFDDTSIYFRAFNTHFDAAVRYHRPESVHAVINLNHSDGVILTSFKRLLPIWRKQLCLEMDLDSGIKTAWPVNRNKIISYQAFAFYDLIRWQYISGNQITNSVVAAALYPNGEYGETAIIQTIKKYIEKIFSINYTDELLAERHREGCDTLLP
ncbi:DUF6387 family protein [Klebsiella pneumoniae]